MGLISRVLSRTYRSKMLRASIQLLIRTDAQLLGKPSTLAQKNFRKFQLEHGSFINKRTNEPLAKATQKLYIRDALKTLSEADLIMFEGKQSAEWKRFLIGREKSHESGDSQ